MTEKLQPADIINFWYSEKIKPYWFNSNKQLDDDIKKQYEESWKNAIRGDFNAWKEAPVGCLALAIIFDQFPLNMFRGEVKSFSTEAMAIKISKYAIEKGFDKEIDKDKLAFLYMPLMHSENIDDQNLSVEVFEKAGLKENLEFAKHHREIIKRYGRFPHRNKILNRESTEDELSYLESDDAFKG